MNRVAPPVATASEVLLPARAATTSLLVPTILDESLGSVVGKIACGSSEEWDDDLEDSADSKTVIVRVLRGDVLVIAKIIKRNLTLEFEMEALSAAAEPACSSTGSSNGPNWSYEHMDAEGEESIRAPKRMKK